MPFILVNVMGGHSADIINRHHKLAIQATKLIRNKLDHPDVLWRCMSSRNPVCSLGIEHHRIYATRLGNKKNSLSYLLGAATELITVTSCIV